MRSLAGLPCQYWYSSSFMASRLSNFLMGKRDFLSMIFPNYIMFNARRRAQNPQGLMVVRLFIREDYSRFRGIGEENWD